MKTKLLIFLIIGFLQLQSCSTRNDKVFSASDELHYVILYEKDNDFELLYNGINKVDGIYSIVGDTILLTYLENEFNSNEKLTRKILIDTKSNKVKSLDNGMQFCAKIQFDKRN
jgi:hypothetical protein